jgi:hypothetical protein
MSATVVILIVVGIILTTVTTALITNSQRIPSDGTIAPTTPTPTASSPIIPGGPTPTPSPQTVEIGVYDDSAFEHKYSSENGITWATVMPGQSTTKTVYIRNEGSLDVSLQLITSSLSPEAAVDKITVTWDKENYTLASDASVSAVLTLSVDASISGVSNYSVDIVITGTEIEAS